MDPRDRDARAGGLKKATGKPLTEAAKHSGEAVRVGLVGLGGHGRTIQTACAAAGNLAVAAVFDVAGDEARAAAVRFGCAEAPSFEALLARGDLDAVVLVTPNPLHRAQAEAVLAAGLHVFVEKPLANTVADGQAMIAAARAAGRILAVGHNLRFSRSAQWAAGVLAEGRLGEVVSVEIHFSADGAQRLAAGAWRLRPEACPLLPVMQLGIHALDLVHMLVGPIEEVFACARSVTTPPGVPDSVAATFRVAGGPMGTMVSNYCTPVAFEFRLAGTEATLRCTPQRAWFRTAAATDGRGDGPAEEHDWTAYDGESYVRQMQAFGEAVRRGTPPEADGLAGLQALAVVEALLRSSETGTPQRVPFFKAVDEQNL